MVQFFPVFRVFNGSNNVCSNYFIPVGLLLCDFSRDRFLSDPFDFVYSKTGWTGRAQRASSFLRDFQLTSLQVPY